MGDSERVVDDPSRIVNTETLNDDPAVRQPRITFDGMRFRSWAVSLIQRAVGHAGVTFMGSGAVVAFGETMADGTDNAFKAMEIGHAALAAAGAAAVSVVIPTLSRLFTRLAATPQQQL